MCTVLTDTGRGGAVAKRSSKIVSRRQRDRSLIAIPRMLPFSAPTRSSRPLSEVEDRRVFSPIRGSRYPRTAGQRPARLRVAGQKGRSPLYLSPRVAFAAPEHVVVCVRRKRRREVLFAKKRTRKGSGSRRRRNFYSEVSC